MELYSTISGIIDVVTTLVQGGVAEAVGAPLALGGSLLGFGVQTGAATQCTEQTCPGSFYTAITTAWANIGYVTHGDVLRFIHNTNFGKWAILLYIGAAITGLLGVATNSPMRNYTWFFIGPALYSFLVGTTTDVQGVNWVVANRAATQEQMAEVWRNAEAGLANTRAVADGILRINGKYGPTSQYEVAMPMVWLDHLFSVTSNIIIEWTGIGRQVDNGGGNSNLSDGQRATVSGRQASEAWWLMANVKWNHIENITASTMRNPDLRDAFITFLASECGDLFKQGIDASSYIAATQARGATVVDTVFVENRSKDYKVFTERLHTVAIPTPRSLARLFKERSGVGGSGSIDSSNGRATPTGAGSFLRFNQRLSRGIETGRTHGIVCSEYLWTIVQGLRFEAGSAYYQMLRSAPAGFDEGGFVTTLLYGWDARKEEGQDIQVDHQKAFLKHLIMAYILRNELLGAPQITTVDQRYAPAEQAKSYSEANVRNFGAKAKFIELYNAAVMMPYLQGILAYFLIVAYPIACMLVILPGHYKGFFTWVSFFAWIKLWDVGFAMVHVVERSVWAMIGNHSHMAATARTLVATAEKVGGIGVDAPSTQATGLIANMEAFDAVPIVCSLSAGTPHAACPAGGPGSDQTFEHAFELFDKLLLTSANLDLDLSNGWYIYIMAALYTAVPAVTGQLVLGAKAGSASLVKDAFQGAANDGGQAAKTGAQHAAVNALQTNQRSIGQMAMAKALRRGVGSDGSSLALQGVMAGNKMVDENIEGTKAGLNKGLLEAQASAAGIPAKSYERAAALAGKMYDGVKGAAGGGSGNGGLDSKLGGYGDSAAKVALGRYSDEYGLESAVGGMRFGAEKAGRELIGSGYKDLSGKVGEQAEFEAASAAWEAKNEFAAHASAMGGIAGMNAGNLAPQDKPMSTQGMGMSGMLDGYTAGGGKAPGQATATANGNNYSGALISPAAKNISEGRGLFMNSNGTPGGWGATAAGKTRSVFDGAGGIYKASDAIYRGGVEGGSGFFNNAGDKAAVEAAKGFAKSWFDMADGKREVEPPVKAIPDRGKIVPGN